MPGWLMLGAAHPSDSRLKLDRNYVQERIMRSPDRRSHTVVRIDGPFKQPPFPSRCA